MAIKPGAILSTSLILLHPSDSRLLCIHHPNFLRWMFPGGRMEPGESPQDAVLREVREEVGLEAALCDLSPLPFWNDGRNRRLAQPFAIIEETIPDKANECLFIDFVFAGVSSHERFTFGAEVNRAAWCDMTELAELETTFPIHDLANAALEDEARIRACVRQSCPGQT